jgi:hypothetical protein
MGDATPADIDRNARPTSIGMRMLYPILERGSPVTEIGSLRRLVTNGPPKRYQHGLRLHLDELPHLCLNVLRATWRPIRIREIAPLYRGTRVWTRRTRVSGVAATHCITAARV